MSTVEETITCNEHVRIYTCLYNRHLLFQMPAGMVTPLGELTPRKPYLIVRMELRTVGEGYHLKVTLWEELYLGVGRNVYIILPEVYATLFTPELMSGINNGTSILKLVLLGVSPWELPILQFYSGV